MSLRTRSQYFVGTVAPSNQVICFLGVYAVKRMIRSLQKDAWERSKQLLPDALVLPPA